jgi:hypothetical protein
MIKFVPPEVAAARTKCAACNAIFPVPLGQCSSQSLASIMPRDFEVKTNNKFWQPQAVQISCPECGAKTMLSLPTKAELGKVLLYGDDAVRESEAVNVFCFTLIGGCKPFVEEICLQVRSIKERYAPQLEATSWSLHMKDLHSGHRRNKHHVFHSWERAKVEAMVDDIFALIARSAKDVFTFNVSFSSTIDQDIARLKQDCYLALAADVIYGFSKMGFTPLLKFDSEKEVVGLGPVIHGWAREAFQGAQRELAYAFISHGLPVPEPEFVKPASHPCLELADFVSFVVARGHHCKMKGKEPDYQSERLGSVFYSWLRKDGHYGRDRRAGFPWEEVYS